MPGEFCWDRETVRAANHASTNMFQAHRGAFAWRILGTAVVFGIDHYSTGVQPYGRHAVERLREKLARSGIEGLGIGINDGEDPGYTRAIIVDSTGFDLESLNALTGEAFIAEGGFPDTPRSNPDRVRGDRVGPEAGRLDQLTRPADAPVPGTHPLELTRATSPPGRPAPTNAAFARGATRPCVGSIQAGGRAGGCSREWFNRLARSASEVGGRRAL